MKNKFLLMVLALVICFSVFTCAACSPKDPGGDGGGQITPGPDDDDDDDETPIVVEPKLEAATNYFDGAKTTYTAALKNENNQTKTFNELLNRQIEAFTQDILVRLVKTYGELDNSNYSISNFNGLNINLSSILIDSLGAVNSTYRYNHSTGGYCHNVETFNIDCVGCYAVYMGGGAHTNTIFKQRRTIEGGFNYNSGFSDTLNTAEKWLLNTNNVENDYLNTYLSVHLNTVKTEVANVLAGTTSQTYEAALEKIGHLGFSATDKQNIINMVKTKIIGNANTTRDQGRKPGVTQINPISIPITDDQRMFKNYELLVPAIVEMAINHTFDGTTNKAYPYASKTAVSNLSLADLALTYNNYETIVLKPKANAPITKLQLQFGTEFGASGAYDIYFTVKNGTGTVINNKLITPEEGAVTINNTGTKYLFNLAANATSSSTLAKYTGDATNYGTTTPFTAEGSEMGTINNGNSYIEIKFVPKTSAISFKVSVSGYYDKVR